MFNALRLEEAGYIDQAIQARDIAEAVAPHKSAFFIEKDSANNLIDYSSAVRGALRLVPREEAEEALPSDFQRMIDDGLLIEDEEPLDHLIEVCRNIQEKANEVHHAEDSQHRL